MAGDWIKMRVDLATDPAVIGIACSLDVSEFEVVGMLHHFWSWADAQSRDGHAAGVTKKWIDRYVHHAGFADELEKCGWLVADEAGITIPNFDRHNGSSAKTRALAKDRQQNRRANPSRETSRTERDNSVTREEKRREEKELPPLSPPSPDAAEKPAKAKAQMSVSDLVALGCDEQHARDWLAVRKAKRAVLTPTSWGALVREAAKAGITPQQAVQIAAENAWQSFKSYYDWRKTHGPIGTAAQRPGRPSLVDQVRDHNDQQERLRKRAAEPPVGAWPEFGSIIEGDGKLVADDDQPLRAQVGQRAGLE